MSRAIDEISPNQLLINAIKTQNLAEIDDILKSDLNIDEIDHIGKSALHEAVLTRDDKIVKKILKKGPNLDLTDLNKQTPLHYAAFIGDRTIIKLLVDAGARTDLKNSSSETCKEISINKHGIDIVEIMLEVDASEESSSSPVSGLEEFLSTGSPTLPRASEVEVTSPSAVLALRLEPYSGAPQTYYPRAHMPLLSAFVRESPSPVEDEHEELHGTGTISPIPNLPEEVVDDETATTVILEDWVDNDSVATLTAEEPHTLGSTREGDIDS